jgi:sulfur carrier protein
MTVIVVNGDRHEAAGELTLADAVAVLTSATTGVAAAVNGEVIRRAEWPQTLLADGDEVEVVTATQGG